MHHRTSRRTLLTATAATVAAAATGAVSAPGAAAASASSSASTTKRLKQLISRMSLEEKVGQLFVMRVYGHSATEPDQADIDANLGRDRGPYRRRADRQVPRRRHHLLRLGAQHP